MANPKFLLEKISDTEYKFILIKPDGTALLTSEPYNDKHSCERGTELVKQNAWSDEVFELRKSPRDHHYYNFKVADNELVATSEMYIEQSERDKNIDEVREFAPEAEIEER